MMNNNDEKIYSQELLNKLTEIENENAKLKVENQGLKNKLEVHNLVETDINKPVSLNDYYISKYLDLHEEIFKNRILGIEDNNQKLKSEYDQIMTELDTLKQNDTELSLEDIEEEVLKLNNKKEELDKNLENKIIELTDLIKKINNMLIDAKRYAVEYYENLVRHLGKASTESTLEYMEFIISVARNSFYDQNVLINDEMTKASYLNKELEDLDKSIEIEKAKIDEEIVRISDATIKEKIEEYEQKSSELLERIEAGNKFKKELTELFKDIKQKHIKEILDQISYMQIRDVVNKEIANSLEELIEVDFSSMLETIDTTTSAKIKRDTEIKSLNLRKAQLDKVQAEYEECAEELGNIESLTDTINQNIKQIEEYSVYALKAIESHAGYQKIYDEYTVLITRKDMLIKEIETLEDELLSFRETRREKVLDPYARPIINELNEKIAQRESKIERSKIQLEKVEKDIVDYPKTKEDLMIVTVINDKIKCDKHLPSLYEKQRKLQMYVSEKLEALNELRKSLDEYDALTEKLEALENETNN